MQTEHILPVLDNDVLKEKANEFAMKGALKSIEEFYTGYNSPYRKAIDEELGKTKIGSGIQLPDIIAIINGAISKEIDTIANTAVSKTFVPLVQRFLTREEKEMGFSEILKKFINCTEPKYPEDCQLELKEDSMFEWLNLRLSCNDKTYVLTLHSDWDTRKGPIKKYICLSLPHDEAKHRETMKLSIDGGTLELPFTRDILQDRFISFIARLVIGKTMVTMDCHDFSDEMFPRDECHC